MKIVVLMGSPNRNGSTGILVQNFQKGAEEAGHSVDVIDICHADIHPCIGCVKCGYEGPCVQKDDVEIVYDVCHEDDMLFNMESLISQKPSSLYILTLEPTVIYTIDYQELKLLASKLPEINELLTRLLERCIIRMTARQHTLDLPPMERYLALMEADSEIIRRTPLKHVAWYLRMAPETLSRVRNKLNNRENSNS